MRESSFKRALMSKLKNIPLSFWESINQKSVAGTADIIGCINGHFVWLELKRSKEERPRAIQLIKMRNVERVNGAAFIVTPENCDAVVEGLKNLTLHNPA